jgi:hypothetical protein
LATNPFINNDNRIPEMILGYWVTLNEVQRKEHFGHNKRMSRR